MILKKDLNDKTFLNNYINLKLKMNFTMNLILKMMKYQVKGSLEKLKEAIVNLLNNIMQ